MKPGKRGMALLLAALLLVASLPAMAEGNPSVSSGNAGSQTLSGNEAEPTSPDKAEDNEEKSLKEESLSGNQVESETNTDEILFNTGNHAWSVVSREAFEQGSGDVYFENDGSYTINIPETNPFFPYEVQFTYNGEVTNEWFMTPEDTVEIGGHTFKVSAYFDGTAITQMSLEVSGDTVIVYPEEKKFTDDETAVVSPMSLIPLKSYDLNTVDLTGYTPVELTMIKVKSVIENAGGNAEGAVKVVWAIQGSSDYTVTDINGTVDLSYGSVSGGEHEWTMIVGDGDQLNPENIRYTVPVKTSDSEGWMTSSVYSEDEAGVRSRIRVFSQNYSESWLRSKGKLSVLKYLYMELPDTETKGKDIYTGLDIDNAAFEKSKIENLKFVKGRYTAEEAELAMAADDVTEQILYSDLSLPGAGILLSSVQNRNITMLAYDADNNLIGCMPFYWSFNTVDDYIVVDLYAKRSDYYSYITNDSLSDDSVDNNIIFSLSDRYALNDHYYMCVDYNQRGNGYPDITAIYVGQYDTIAAAKAAGAEDITSVAKGAYISSSSIPGYEADFSQGIWFTVFAGEDTDVNRKVFSFLAKTSRRQNTEIVYSGASITFKGLVDANGKDVPSHVINSGDDSLGESNYVTILVEEDTDLGQQYAPVFTKATGSTVYTGERSVPEESGITLHSFANGPVQYTVSAQNGVNYKNYWVQIKKVSSADGQLYISGLDDPNSDKRYGEDGAVYLTREVMLDSYHNYVHDICLVNVGNGDLPALTAELSSDVLEMDDYWTLTGQQSLRGFSTLDTPSEDSGMEGELPNLAKIRLRAKDGVVNGTDVTGTLTIKSAGKTLMVLTLTGVVGDPCIITTEIPAAVKYVPYGTMIQNSNKYSWIKTSYELYYGNLPEGVELKPNGELYGTPKETGEFTFGVQAIFSNIRTGDIDNRSYAILTLIVQDNTNANVFNASDIAEGYSLETAIGVETSAGSYDYYLEEIRDSLFVSEGQYNEFIDVWLNGERLDRSEYTSESGSTRITISAQTLQNKALKTGNNTIAAEFRVGGDINNELRRTAQNFHLDERDSDSGNGSGSASGGRNETSAGGGSGSPETSVTLVGFVVDENNAPMANMTVELHSTPRSTVTAENGFFQFTGVEFGEHTLYVKDQNANILASQKFEIRQGDTFVFAGNVITAAPGTGITLTVKVANGAMTLSAVAAGAGNTAQGANLMTTAADTGDSTNMAPWLSLLAISCAVAVGLAVMIKKRSRNGKVE